MDTTRQADGGGSGAVLSDEDKETVSATAATVGRALEEADGIRRRAAANFDVRDKLRLAERFVCDGDPIYKAMFSPQPPAKTPSKAAPAKAASKKATTKEIMEPAPIDAPLTEEQKLLHVAQLRLEAANKVSALPRRVVCACVVRSPRVAKTQRRHPNAPQALLDLRTFVLAEVSSFYYPSIAVQRVCVAALALAGSPLPADADWERIQSAFSQSAIEQMRLVDAAAAPQPGLWELVRGALHDLDEDLMEQEARSVLLLSKWVQAVRTVSEAAEAAAASVAATPDDTTS